MKKNAKFQSILKKHDFEFNIFMFENSHCNEYPIILDMIDKKKKNRIVIKKQS